MHVSIGKAAMLLGVSISTMRRCELEGYLSPSFRTSGGHRRYEICALETRFSLVSLLADAAHALAYARVSSHDQKKDLETQLSKLKTYCDSQFASYELLSDLGSGLNYKKPGLRKLLHLIFQKKITHLVLNHKDSLLRFGSELVFELCRHFDIKVIILESRPDQSIEMELDADVIELMTVFSSRLYGKRSHQNRKRVAA